MINFRALLALLSGLAIAGAAQAQGISLDMARETAPGQSALTADGAARVSLIDGWRQPDGSRMAAIEIDLAPGWHTYWRVPGDSGIPPEFDWSGSTNIKSIAYLWPRPRIITSSGDLTFGYSDRLVLPVLLVPERPDQAMDLSVQTYLGVCAEICQQASPALATRIAPDAPSRSAELIRAAMADRPRSAQEAGVTSVACEIVPGQDGYALTADITFSRPPGPGQYAAFETSIPGLWIGRPETQVIGNRLIARADMDPTGGGGVMLDRESLRITIIGNDRAIDIAGCGMGDGAASRRASSE